MSGRSSPANGGYEAAGLEPALRLSVRKDLFPEERLDEPSAALGPLLDDVDAVVSCVKLETDFEQSIDDIANQRLQVANGALPAEQRSRHRKHKQHSRREDRQPLNGYLPVKSKKRKSSSLVSESKPHRTKSHRNVPSRVKGGKNLNLVSSSECRDEDEEEEEESSDDESLYNFRRKLPLMSAPRPSGKPYSHELSQLSSKKSKSKDSSKRKSHAVVIPCSGKPRSMLDICSSKSKKKKKLESKPTYHSQLLDTNNTLKIKIRKTGAHHVVTPTPTSIADIGQRKSKKKRAASPEASASSGEEYDPSRAETAATIYVSAPKQRHPRHPPPKAKKTSAKPKDKKPPIEKTERPRSSKAESKDTGPQSPWAHSMPEEILTKIFEFVVNSQGTLPSVIRLGRVCKLWHVVSCKPELWRSVDLAQNTVDKSKTDYKLVWLLENRLRWCNTLNIGHWKANNVPWVLACLAEYCPELAELGLAGWSRLAAEHLYELFHTLPKLRRLDLSQTSEVGGSGSCLTAGSVTRVMESFGARITHLTLANNRFTALQQILTSIASHCAELEVLDISGARASSHPAAVPLEALQKGCPKLRVFRAANAQLVLAAASTAQQMETSGWSQLEELSVAGEAATERVAVGEYRLHDEAIARLVKDATRLRLLDLRGLQRLSDSGLVRVPAWDLSHLFLGGCNVTRQSNACLDLICEKWSHSLVELDLSWASATRALDGAVAALADSSESKLKILNLCGSSVSLEPVKKVLLRCKKLESLNLSSCRALPRGMKRHYIGKELEELKDSLDPEKIKAKEKEKTEKAEKDKIEKSESSKSSASASPSAKSKDEKTSPSIFQEPKSIAETLELSKQSPSMKTSPDSKSIESMTSKDSSLTSPPDTKILSPIVQSKPDSSSTPRSETSKTDAGSPHFSPVSKPDSQVQNSPDIQPESVKSNNSWSLGQFKTTPTHKSEASPLNRTESQSKLKYSKVTEQCSPTTSLENKLSPDAVPNVRQDIKTTNSWNYGNYSPMPRQDSQFSTQRSPYSAQPSPAQPSPYSAQPSPYSAQPSPYSTQPSPYSSQPSPYSAQPSPDTSQIVKADLQKSGSTWNSGSYSPMTKHPAPFSPHAATVHNSPDPGLNVKGDGLRNSSNKTPGQYSPMSRQDRIHQSPYSPRPSVDNVAMYSNKKSPGVGNYSPMMRPDDTGATSRQARMQDVYGRAASKSGEVPASAASDLAAAAWGLERFSQQGSVASIESLLWGTQYSAEPVAASRAADTVPAATVPAALNTPPPQQTWTGLPSFDSGVRRHADDMSDPWSLTQFRVEPPHQSDDAFESNVNFDALSHIGHQQHIQNFIDDNFSETSRVD